MSNFSQDACDAALSKVDMSQVGIQAVSAKLLFWKRSAVEVVRCWERAFQRADMDKRLSLIYLVNDVVQTSRRSGREYTEAFHKALPEAFRHMMKHTDEKVQQKLKKLVLVWRDRNVWGNKALGLYLEMVRGVSINASPEVRPKPQAGPQSMPDSIATAAGLFRELQQAQAAVQNAASAESAKATSDVPPAQVRRTSNSGAIHPSMCRFGSMQLHGWHGRCFMSCTADYAGWHDTRTAAKDRRASGSARKAHRKSAETPAATGEFKQGVAAACRSQCFSATKLHTIAAEGQ